MKKAVLLSFILFISFKLFSQGASGGFKAGLNLSNQTVTINADEEDTDVRVSAHFGVYFFFPFKEKFGLQTEVLYSSQGSEYSSGKYFRFGYINVPVLARFNFNKFNFHLGPQVGFLVGAKMDDSAWPDFAGYFNETDLSIATGVGYDTPVGLSFGTRFSFSLLDISELEYWSFKNQNLQFYVGYRLTGGADD